MLSHRVCDTEVTFWTLSASTLSHKPSSASSEIPTANHKLSSPMNGIGDRRDRNREEEAMGSSRPFDPYICPYDSHQFGNFNLWQRHMREEHKKNFLLTCLCCSYSLDSRESEDPLDMMLQHQSTHKYGLQIGGPDEARDNPEPAGDNVSICHSDQQSTISIRISNDSFDFSPDEYDFLQMNPLDPINGNVEDQRRSSPASNEGQIKIYSDMEFTVISENALQLPREGDVPSPDPLISIAYTPSSMDPSLSTEKISKVPDSASQSISSEIDLPLSASSTFFQSDSDSTKGDLKHPIALSSEDNSDIVFIAGPSSGTSSQTQTMRARMCSRGDRVFTKKSTPRHVRFASHFVCRSCSSKWPSKKHRDIHQLTCESQRKHVINGTQLHLIHPTSRFIRLHIPADRIPRQQFISDLNLTRKWFTLDHSASSSLESDMDIDIAFEKIRGCLDTIIRAIYQQNPHLKSIETLIGEYDAVAQCQKLLNLLQVPVPHLHLYVSFQEYSLLDITRAFYRSLLSYLLPVETLLRFGFNTNHHLNDSALERIAEALRPANNIVT